MWIVEWALSLRNHHWFDSFMIHHSFAHLFDCWMTAHLPSEVQMFLSYGIYRERGSCLWQELAEGAISKLVANPIYSSRVNQQCVVFLVADCMCGLGPSMKLLEVLHCSGNMKLLVWLFFSPFLSFRSHEYFIFCLYILHFIFNIVYVYFTCTLLFLGFYWLLP